MAVAEETNIHAGNNAIDDLNNAMGGRPTTGNTGSPGERNTQLAANELAMGSNAVYRPSILEKAHTKGTEIGRTWAERFAKHGADSANAAPPIVNTTVPDLGSVANTTTHSTVENVGEVLGNTVTPGIPHPGTVVTNLQQSADTARIIADGTDAAAQAANGTTHTIVNGTQAITSGTNGTAHGVAGGTHVITDGVSNLGEGIDSTLPGAANAVTEGSTIVEGAAAGGWSTAGRIAGKAAMPLAVIAGTVETGIALRHHDGRKAVKAASGTAGGIFGGWGGAAAGGLAGGVITGMAEAGLIGATLGSVLPVVGTIIFGIAGALIGGYLASKAGNKVAGDWAEKKFGKGDLAPKQELAQAQQTAVSVAPEATQELSAASDKHAAQILQRRAIQAQ